jgi:putative flippase GtrA
MVILNDSILKMIKNFIYKYIKIVRYIFAGGLATFSNLMILFVLVHYFKLWYLTSAIISFCVAVIISYLLQKFFVFKNYMVKDIHKQFLNFFVYNIIMLGFNTLLMYFFVEILIIWYLLAQAISAIIGAFINYIYFNKIVFKNNI